MCVGLLNFGMILLLIPDEPNVRWSGIWRMPWIVSRLTKYGPDGSSKSCFFFGGEEAVVGVGVLGRCWWCFMRGFFCWDLGLGRLIFESNRGIW